MLFSKLKWVLGLSLVFILILATNLIDRNNFVIVRDSIITIYEDRLVAKDRVLELSSLVHEKSLAVALQDGAFFEVRNKSVNKRILELITTFRNSDLTYKANRTLTELEENLQGLKVLEDQIKEGELSLGKKGAPSALGLELSQINENLDDLASIQMEEGRKQMVIGKKAVDSVELMTKMEMYLLIFIALIVQVLILYNPGSKSKDE